MGTPAASHRVVCDYRMLSSVFTPAGFDVRLLEWWDERGTFHAEPWEERDGFSYRSQRLDRRDNRGPLVFTSPISDVVKLRMVDCNRWI